MVKRIILDTDLAMGAGADIDDGFALAFALADPELQIDFITTVHGNTDVKSATLLTIELLNRLRHPQIPVYQGAAAPLLGGRIPRVPGEETLAHFGHHRPEPGYGPLRIVEHVMANPGEITLVAIGPLTNVAIALALEPRLVKTVAEIVVMGGVFFGQTLDSSMPGEFNVWMDPEAAHIVMQSGIPARWVGLDVTRQVRLSRTDAAEMAKAGGQFGSFAAKATLAWIDHQMANSPGDPEAAHSCAMHDPLAVAVISNPDLVVWQSAYIDVVTGGGIARGVVVTDSLRTKSAPVANSLVASNVDAPRFRQIFMSAMTRV